MGGLTQPCLEAALPFLDLLPDPVLWIRPDYSVAWRNRAAAAQYGKGEDRCFTLSHGRDTPCDEDGEFCPKHQAENKRASASVVHAHTSPGAEPDFYRVLAIPIEAEGVLEIHSKLGSGMVRDELTGLYRREFWTEIVRRDQALLGRLNRPYALLFLDLDRFKSFNDVHGHLVGDQLLRLLGIAVRRWIRASDAACRFGGEEFVLFLPNTTLSSATQLAERIRGEMRSLQVKTSAGPRSVTVSIGVHATDAAEPLVEAMEHADAALYRAKQTGRDRVCASRTTKDRSAEAER